MESVFLPLIFFFFLDQANKMKAGLFWYCMTCNLSNLVTIYGENVYLRILVELLVSEKLHLNSNTYAVNIIVYSGPIKKKKKSKKEKALVTVDLNRFIETFLTLR